MATRKVKIKWKSIYFPCGKWVNEDGIEVQYKHPPEIPHFRATIDGKPVLVIMVDRRSGGGHGEPPVEAKVPCFLDEKTLCELDSNSWIEINFEI